MLALLRRLRGSTSTTEIQAAYKANGLNKLYCAVENIPHVDMISFVPQDALHLFPDGLLRHEAAWLVYVMDKHGVQIPKINAAIRAYKDFPLRWHLHTHNLPHNKHTRTCTLPPPGDLLERTLGALQRGAAVGVANRRRTAVGVCACARTGENGRR